MMTLCRVKRSARAMRDAAETLGERGVFAYITLHYITLHCIILHYIILHYIHSIPLHAKTLGERLVVAHITLQYITLHYIVLHCIALHYTARTDAGRAARRRVRLAERRALL